VAAYHDAFKEILNSMCRQLPSEPKTGTYHYADHEIDYHYALWDYNSTTMMLIQHHEGDGHLGHEASASTFEFCHGCQHLSSPW